MVEGSASAFEERSDIVRQPQGREDRTHGSGEPPGNVALSHHQGDVLGDPDFSPHLENVLHQLRLLIKRFPGDGAGLKRVMLERDEGQV